MNKLKTFWRAFKFGCRNCLNLPQAVKDDINRLGRELRRLREEREKQEWMERRPKKLDENEFNHPTFNVRSSTSNLDRC